MKSINLTFLAIILLALLSCGKSPLKMIKKSTEASSISGLENSKTFKSTQQNLTINWLSPINSTDEGHALLIVKNDSYAADLPENFILDIWMPDMGHGSSPIKIKKLGTGLYDLSEIYFIMDGYWQLRIRLKNNSSILEEQIFEYNL